MKKKLIFIILIVVIMIATAISLISHYEREPEIRLSLNGDSEITVYQHEAFKDPGFRLTTLRSEDMEKEVVVENPVNIAVAGKYEMRYILGNTVVTRIVNVVPRDGTEETEPEAPTEAPEKEVVLFDPDITFDYKYVISEDYMPYGLFTPSSAKDYDKIPVIVSLHGSSEVGKDNAFFRKKFLVDLFNNWELEGFNAYIVCPHLTGNGYSNTWANNKSAENLFALLDHLVEELNIDPERIILQGHSLGGQGVLHMALYNPDYFSAIIPVSAYNVSGDLKTIRDIPIKAFCGSASAGEDSNSINYMKRIFKDTLGEYNLIEMDVSHDNAPKTVFITDENGDGRSDLIEWALNQRNELINY